MAKQARRVIVDEEPVDLNIDIDKVCYIISKARAYDVKVPPVNEDPGSNPADDKEWRVLEDYPDDATFAELRAVIDTLNEDETVDLIALAWTGRGDFTRADWAEARALADERHRQHSARYLLGIPTLGDYLDDGLAELGHSCREEASES